MEASRAYEFIQIVWPDKKGNSEFNKDLYKFRRWDKARSKFLSMAGFLYYLTDGKYSEVENELQSDLLFLAGIASIREIIG
ncbi:MAG: hypothetical protein QM500_04090 [Methylococcales bacterium]